MELMTSSDGEGRVSEWTKGPWEFGEPDANGQPTVRCRDYEVATCWHHCVGSIEKEAHANARLIASAPEMAEALEGLLDALVVHEETPGTQAWSMTTAVPFAMDRARAALAKARGAQ